MKIFTGSLHSQLNKSIMGAHPLIQFYLNKLRIAEIFSSYIKNDSRLAIPIEKGVHILLHNILTERLPLYQMNEWITPLDLECLGLSADEAATINDDRMGRVLDAVAKSNRKTIFFRIALRMIKLFELDCSHVHQDTTSIKFFGRYENWLAEPQIDHGHSKDHRPDLKQLVLGINVVGDGAVPISHHTYSGNRTDDVVHISNWDHLRRLLQTSDFIYTADSKLCTNNNLRHIEFYGGQYITVMPRTWKEDQQFRELARAGKIKWRLILKRPNNRQPEKVIDKYYTSTSSFYQAETGRRLIWIKSTEKVAIDQQIRAKHLDKTRAELDLIKTKLNRYKLKRLPDIKGAIEKIIIANKTKDLIRYSVQKQVVVTKSFLTRGRPTAHTPTKTHQHIQYQLAWEVNKAEVTRQARTDGIFPLLTNILRKSPCDILQIYKYQSFLENRHSQLKTELAVSPMYLKKRGRILALLDLVVLALVIATLMERDLRNGMKRQGINSIPIYPEERECKHPTAYSIIRTFQSIEKFKVIDREGKVIEYFPPMMTPLQKQILNLMEVPLALYA